MEQNFSFDAREAPDDLLLLQYVAGELSAVERTQVAQWLAVNPDGQARVDELSAVWRHTGFRFAAEDAERALLQVREKIAALAPVHVPVQTGRKVGDETPYGKPAVGAHISRRSDNALPIVSRRVWYAVAGLVLGAIGVVAGWRMWTHRAAETAQVVTYATTNGQRANITLPDGSTAILNVASRLDVPVNYNMGNRTLRLTGEALFTVVHQGRAPFTVIAGATTARVLGTSFLVRHYAGDSLATVAVREGRVAVRSTVLGADQEAEIGATGIPHVHSTVLSQFSFSSGVLTLEDMPLPQAIVELDRWYDVDIRLGASRLAAQRMKGKFAAGSAADLAGILELTFNVRVVREGRVLTLYPKG